LPFVAQLMKAGVAAFKIEGRARNPEYVKTVVTAYKKAVEAVLAGTFTPALAQQLTADCAHVYHRPFSVGMYYGRPGEQQYADTDENQATSKKHHVGVVLNYYKQAKVGQIQIQGHGMKTGDQLAIHGPTTGVVELTATNLRRDTEQLERADKGTWVTIPCEQQVRTNDKVYIVLPAN